MATANDFDWARVLVVPARTEQGEQRFKVLGHVAAGVVSAIVTPRGERVRIISLRVANQKERRLYASQVRNP